MRRLLPNTPILPMTTLTKSHTKANTDTERVSVRASVCVCVCVKQLHSWLLEKELEDMFFFFISLPVIRTF